MTILSYVECTYFTQSNIGISGGAEAIFVVGQTLKDYRSDRQRINNVLNQILKNQEGQGPFLS